MTVAGRAGLGCSLPAAPLPLYRAFLLFSGAGQTWQLSELCRKDGFSFVCMLLCHGSPACTKQNKMFLFISLSLCRFVGCYCAALISDFLRLESGLRGRTESC